jgi:chemotaxis response regulator CheB
MPGEAVQMGAAGDVLPLGQIAPRMLELVEEMDVTRAPTGTG